MRSAKTVLPKNTLYDGRVRQKTGLVSRDLKTGVRHGYRQDESKRDFRVKLSGLRAPTCSNTEAYVSLQSYVPANDHEIMPNDAPNGNSPECVNDHSSIKSVKSSNDYGTFEQNGDGRSTYGTAQAMDHSSNSANGDRPSLWKQWLSFGIWFVYDQWFLFGLSFLILVSWRIQVPKAQQSLKETVVTYLCVAVIFFVTGCTLPTQVLVQNYKRWRLHLFCQVQSFFLTSVIVFGIVSACASNPNFMDGGLLVGLIFTGCVPTTISSNVIMTKQANGNQALTVVQSTLGNFLGPFVAPLLILMYLSCNAWYTDIVPKIATGEFGELYRRVFKQLGLSIFLPLVSVNLVTKAHERRDDC